jgi:kynurenine formamidase
VSAELFEATKRWGRWGEDDDRGALNLLTPERVIKAAALVRDGVSVRCGRQLATAPAVDNPNPALHHMIRAGDVAASEKGLQWAGDFIGVAFHGNSVSHMDALCHVFVDGRMYNDAPATDVTSVGARRSSIEVAEDGIVGRGVLLDIPRLRGVDWLEPGEAVTRAELEAIEAADGVRLGEGDILVFRTGHHARRLALGPWSNEYPPAGEGKAGLHVDTVPWMHERRIAAFLPDGDGETVPSNVEGVPYPMHPLQLTAMGMCIADSLQLEDLARACAQEGRWEFMAVGLPLRLPGGTGSPWNPIAMF